MILLIHLNTLPQEVGLQSHDNCHLCLLLAEAGTKHWCITGENNLLYYNIYLILTKVWE